MCSLQQKITAVVSAAFASNGYYPSLGEVFTSDHADFQCNGALRGAKEHTQSPRQIAEAVAATLSQATEIFAKVSVEGPGFLNLTLNNDFLAAALQEYGSQENLIPQTNNPYTVIVDFGGPNVAKPLHVGHLRSSIIGDSVQRLYRAMGHTVFGDIHLGDWGTPMGILIAMIAQEQPNLPYFDAAFSGPYPAESPVSFEDLERLYPAGSNLLKSDEDFKRAAQQATAELQGGRAGYRALWQHFIEVSELSLRENFDRLSVTFDWWYGESHYHDRTVALVERLRHGGAELSNGALIIPLPEQDGTEIPPLILLKSDGAFLYSTTDLAAIEERVQENQATELVYVVDQRQHLHFVQVFAAARKIGIVPESVTLTHAGFGTMNGADGKPFKTRAGGVMKLQDLIELVTNTALTRMNEIGLTKEYPEAERLEIAEKVGIAALKFGDLINNRVSNYIFDPERFVSFEGKTGPYLVYTVVRIRSIHRKLELTDQKRTLLPPTEIERPLMLALSRLPEVLADAHANLTPHTLAEHAFVLAQEFNRFYQQTNIMRETDAAKQASWIALTELVLRELETLLSILGIETPDRM